MIILTDCAIGGARNVIISNDSTGDRDAMLVANMSSYDLLRDCLKQGIDISQGIPHVDNARRVNLECLNIERYYPPLKPFDDRDVMISAFGNTHTIGLIGTEESC